VFPFHYKLKQNAFKISFFAGHYFCAYEKWHKGYGEANFKA